MTDTWSPAQYEKFEREREQPFHDLLALVHPVPGGRAVDLGCGTGKLTRLLHERVQAVETLGLDRSAKMLETALREAQPAGLRFEAGTIEAFLEKATADPHDVIFSNAALHWVERHDVLIERLFAALGPGGQLAFQVPAMHDGIQHTVAEDITRLDPFREAFGGWEKPQPVLAPDEYARLLYRTGFRDPIVRLIVYPHVLAGPEAVVEWTKGTLLTEYGRHLPSHLFDAFVEQYRVRLLDRLEPARPCFFPFKRILCWGQRA